MELRWKSLFYARPQPDPLPQEKEPHLHVSGFAADRSANPVACIFEERQMALPLLGGEGRGEDGRSI